MTQEMIAMGILGWAIITCYVLYDNYRLTLKIDDLSHDNAKLIQAIDYNNEDHQLRYDQAIAWAEGLRKELMVLKEKLEESKSDSANDNLN